MKKIMTYVLFFMLFCFFGSSMNMTQAQEAAALPVASDSSGSSDSEEVFRVFSPLDLVDKESSQSLTPPLEFSLQDDPNAPVPPILDSIDSESARIDVIPVDPISEFDPVMLQEGFPTTDSTAGQTEEEAMPVRSPGHWLASSWMLVALMVLMVLAFLYYIATTEGKWPVNSSSDESSKKRKKNKK